MPLATCWASAPRQVAVRRQTFPLQLDLRIALVQAFESVVVFFRPWAFHLLLEIHPWRIISTLFNSRKLASARPVLRLHEQRARLCQKPVFTGSIISGVGGVTLVAVRQYIRKPGRQPNPVCLSRRAREAPPLDRLAVAPAPWEQLRCRLPPGGGQGGGAFGGAKT